MDGRSHRAVGLHVLGQHEISCSGSIQQQGCTADDSVSITPLSNEIIGQEDDVARVLGQVHLRRSVLEVDVQHTRGGRCRGVEGEAHSTNLRESSCRVAIAGPLGHAVVQRSRQGVAVDQLCHQDVAKGNHGHDLSTGDGTSLDAGANATAVEETDNREVGIFWLREQGGSVVDVPGLRISNQVTEVGFLVTDIHALAIQIDGGGPGDGGEQGGQGRFQRGDGRGRGGIVGNVVARVSITEEDGLATDGLDGGTVGVDIEGTHVT